MKHTLKIHNPNNLPTMPYTQFVEFQGDLKAPISPENLQKFRESLKKHGVFVPKFVWVDEEGKANILDGHQTKQGIASLEAEGWTIPEIPYVVVDAENRDDAAEKLLQINSRYATINPDSEWVSSLTDIGDLLASIEIPELSDVLTENLSQMDQDLRATKATLDRPFQRIHILLTVPIDHFHEIAPMIEELDRNPYVESVQSGN